MGVTEGDDIGKDPLLYDKVLGGPDMAERTFRNGDHPRVPVTVAQTLKGNAVSQVQAPAGASLSNVDS